MATTTTNASPRNLFMIGNINREMTALKNIIAEVALFHYNPCFALTRVPLPVNSLIRTYTWSRVRLIIEMRVQNPQIGNNWISL